MICDTHDFGISLIDFQIYGVVISYANVVISEEIHGCDVFFDPKYTWDMQIVSGSIIRGS